MTNDAAHRRPGGREGVAVIGGGPAGLFAAERIARAGHGVTVYDRMPSVARKFLLAGHGGLNLTHGEPLPVFLDRYGAARDWMAPLIEAFSPDALASWCEALGQPTFRGSSGRIFPECFKTSPLLRAWLARLSTLGVQIETRHRWTGWDESGALRFQTPTGPVAVPAPGATVLALGGASWPRLGADGAWQPILEGAGVPVVPLEPANMGFTRPWSAPFLERFEGAPLRTVGLTVVGRSLRGQAVVTRTGIEGGAIYALSRDLREGLKRGGAVTLTLDLRPDVSCDALIARLRKIGTGPSLSNRLRKAGLDPLGIRLCREVGGKDLPREPEDLAALIKALPLTLDGVAGLERAISTAGGVARNALESDLMLAARPGTFLAGEMLDWEAPTGGYLLQGCFATAARAADGVIRHLKGERP